MDYNNNGNVYNYQQPVYVDPPMQSQEPKRGKAIAALILGIASVVFCCCCNYVGVICGIIGIVLACLSKKDNGKFSGMAMTGLIFSIVGTIGSFIMVIIGIVGVFGKGGFSDSYRDYINNIYDELGLDINL